MAKQVIDKFKGIAPALGNNLALGMAVVASDIDLSSGKIRPVKDNSLVQTDISKADSIFYHGGAWQIGSNRSFVSWRINDIDILFYLDSGVIKKKVAGVVANLGQDAPGKADGESVKPDPATTTTRINLTDSTLYEWLRSGSGESEFYCRKADGTNPGITKPDKLLLADVESQEGTVGSLVPDAWGWGDNDSLGYSTVYVRLPRPQTETVPEEYLSLTNRFGAYKWFASAVSGEYYYAQKDGSDPNIADPLEVIFDGIPTGSGDNFGYTDVIKGTRQTVGSLSASYAWGYGNNDSLGYSTVYVKIKSGRNPNNLPPSSITAAIDTLISGEDVMKKVTYLKDDGDVGDVNGQFVRYTLTWTRNVGGHVDESGPSYPSDEIEVFGDKVTVTRPSTSDSNVTHWNLYRLSNNTGEYLFLATVPITETTYADNTADADLGPSLTTWYTSDQDNDITFAKPLTGMSGLSTEMYAGMIFAWKGNDLYWSEPGLPDAWPSQYTMAFPANIKRVIPFAGTVVVLTSVGPFRVDGTHPELLQPSKVLGDEPCIATAACATPKGIAYLSDSGVVLFNLVETRVITDGIFGEGWFKANVTSGSAVLAQNDSILFLFHSGGTLKADARSGQIIWTTESLIAYAAHRRPDDGELYIMSASGIEKMYGGTNVLPWEWRSGDILMGSEQDKAWIGTDIRGADAVGKTLYVDGSVAASKAAIDFKGLERDRRLKLPNQTVGRAAQVGLGGTGSVDEISIEAVAK